jgi:hypothetical protein
MPNALKLLLVPVVCAAFLLTGCAVYQPTGAYGVYESTFLGACEVRNRVPFCNCVLGYLEQTVSLQQAVYDGNAINAGGAVPQYVHTGEAQCQFA